MAKNEKAPNGAEITINLDYELYSKLLELSDKKGLDMSSQIKFILWNYFQNISQE